MDQITADDFSNFFGSKVADAAAKTAHASFPIINTSCVHSLSTFNCIDEFECKDIVNSCATKHCELDPLPTWLLKQCIDVFAPILTYICNRSLRENVLPTCQKSAVILPLLKKSNLNKSELKNYRPVSNLSFLSKFIERVVCSQLTSYLEVNKLLPDNQSAYRRNHSTETALLKIFSDICDAADIGQATLLALLDLSSAFDLVDLDILLERLQKTFGVSGDVLAWIKSYLTGRHQKVLLNGTYSTDTVLTRGVPQGSVLGPILFIMYTSPVFDIIRAQGLLSHAYADDSQLYSHCFLHDAPLCIQRSITQVQQWMESNRLLLNPSKTELIWIASPTVYSKLPTGPILLGDGSVINISKSVKNLGATLDCHLNMHEHVSKCVQGAFFQLRQIKSIRRCISDDDTKCLLHALVTNKIDYCNAILFGLPQYVLNKLQSVLNSAARVFARCNYFAHITPILRDQLHWLRINERISFKVATLAHKSFTCLPSYLSESCIPSSESRYSGRTRSMATRGLKVPLVKTKFFGSRSFCSSAPTVWNALPVDLRLEPSFEIFKTKLKTFLFSRSFSL